MKTQILLYLLIFWPLITSINVQAQSRGIKFYSDADSVRYEELQLMINGGREMVIENGKFVIKITDSTLLERDFNRDSLFKLVKEIRTYRYLTYDPNEDYANQEEFQGSNRKDTIQYISFSGQDLKKLPLFDLLKCKNLRTVELVNTSVEKIPWLLNWSIFKLDSLKTIKVFNHQSANPLKFTKNTHFTKIDYSESPYAPLPKGISKVKKLEKLDLVRNDLHDVSTLKLSKLKNLKELNLSRNNIQINQIARSEIKSLSNLILSYCSLESIPTQIKYFPNLKELQLAENKIKSENIAPEIANLKELEILSFYKNDLTFLPVWIFELNQLEELDLYYNTIEIVPQEIGQLKKLERLYLANNRLYNIPDEIGKLAHLKELYLKHNRISYLPNTLCKLEKITDFHINDNYIQGFPECILAFKQLRDLDISNNEIHSIPSELLDLEKLKLLWMRGITFEASNREEAKSIKNTIEGLQKKGVKVSLDLE